MEPYSCPLCFHLCLYKRINIFTIDITLSQQDFADSPSLNSNKGGEVDYDFTSKMERKDDGTYHEIISIFLPKGCYNSEIEVYFQLSSSLHKTLNKDLFMYYTEGKKTLNLAGSGLKTKRKFNIHPSNFFINHFCEVNAEQTLMNPIIFSDTITTFVLKETQEY